MEIQVYCGSWLTVSFTRDGKLALRLQQTVIKRRHISSGGKKKQKQEVKKHVPAAFISD